MASVRTYITETEFARIDNPQSSTTYIVLDDNDPTVVKKVVFKTNNINNEGEVYIVQDEFPTPSGAVEITANGDNIDVKQYATANVNVPNPSTGSLEITINDTYDVTDYAGVSVNVPNPSTGTLNITVNDDYDVTDYAGVSVNVPNPSTGTLNITSNDTYDVTNYASAEVNVPQPSGKITISQNGTDIDIAQYAAADVNVQPPVNTCSFKFNSDGQFQFNKLAEGKYYLKTNNGSWVEYDATATIDVYTNDVIELKSSVHQIASSSLTFNDRPNSSFATVSWELEGDLIGALYGDTFPIKGCFQIFKNCTGLTKVPSNMFANYDYVPERGCYEMFYGCTSLTVAPTLPATIVTESCYQSMFYGCTSLTTAPELPATTMLASSYQNMFYGCTSLTTAPELPATTLVSNCYTGMFRGCTSLTTPPPELSATALAYECYRDMFRGCTSLTTAPELPAASGSYGCCQDMFRECSSLNYVKCLATNTSSTYFNNWLRDVSATGTFVKDANTTWPSGNSGIPSGWTVQDA